jgi:hypothetical protein
MLGAVLMASLAGCGGVTSGAQKMAACIESSGEGWHRVTQAFQIKGLGRLDLIALGLVDQRKKQQAHSSIMTMSIRSTHTFILSWRCWARPQLMKRIKRAC